MKKVKYVDPPSGWMYGFPAILEEGKSLTILLKEHNYPENLFDLALSYSRYWEEEIEDQTPS